MAAFPSFLPILLRCSCIVGIERAQATASPSRHKIGRACVLASVLFRLPIALQLIGQREEGAEQSSTIVVHKFDQSGFLDEAAEFDQVSGACTSVLDPLAFVVAGAALVEAVTQHGQVLELRCCVLEFLEQGLWVLLVALVGFRGGEARTGQLGCEHLVRERERA